MAKFYRAMEGGKLEAGRCKHRDDSHLTYMQADSDAVARMKRGQKQGKCPWCGKYIWPDHFETRADYLEAMDLADAIAREIKKIDRADKRSRSTP